MSTCKADDITEPFGNEIEKLKEILPGRERDPMGHDVLFPEFRYDRKAYLDFLQSKAAKGETKTFVEFDESLIHPSTFPHQRDAILWALRRQCALIAMSFGLGKTQIAIEVARLLLAAHPGSKFLLVCPLGVRLQFINKDGPRLGVQWKYVTSDETLAQSETPFVLTNYERLRDGNITPAKHDIIGVNLDEGNIIRSLGSKTVDVFLRIFAHVPYRFVSTATPSPNNYREIIYYGDFLGVMDHGECLTRFFKRNPDKAGDLQISPQHERAFWLWVSTWALFLHTPSDMGHSDDGYILPPLNVHWHRSDVDHSRARNYADNRGQVKLFLDATGGVSEMASEKRHTIVSRLATAQKIMADNPNRHWILWHHLEDERRAIQKAIPEAVSVYGALDLEIREQRVIDFSDGKLPILSTKPRLTGSGCNLQHFCHSNIFLGVDYSFNDLAQAIHRTHRFQQQHPVDVHIIYAESEEPIAEALKRKWVQHDALVERMRAIIREYGLDHRLINEELKRKIGVQRMETISKRFKAANNDCVLETSEMLANSVDLIFSSPPFSKHYEYSTQIEDMGHNDDDEAFFKQMDFLIPQLYRVLKPGRSCVMHSKDLIHYGHATKSGFMEIYPFTDDLVRAFRKHGFIAEGRITVTTDVVRENNSTYRLGWSEMCRDSTKMGCGLPEYILLFRKPPSSPDTARADDPVSHSKKEYTRARWQIDAHAYWRSNGNRIISQEMYDYHKHVARLESKDAKGNLPASFFVEPPVSTSGWVWDDIQPMRCLNSEQSRRKIRNHCCPLPLDICERIIELRSNPGEVVLDPFGGLFTIPYCAIKLGRIGWGIELSKDYYADGVQYCRQIEEKVTAPTLFDLPFKANEPSSKP